MKNNMVMSSWTENASNNESNQPWHQGQASNLKSSCDSLGISQATSIKCDFVVIIKFFSVPFSYLESFTVQSSHNFRLDELTSILIPLTLDSIFSSFTFKLVKNTLAIFGYMLESSQGIFSALETLAVHKHNGVVALQATLDEQILEYSQSFCCK